MILIHPKLESSKIGAVVTNKEFLLAVASERDLYEHARKLVAVAEAAKRQIEDDGYNPNELYKALENLEQQ